MIEYENWCVDCDIHCIGSACLHSEPVYVTYSMIAMILLTAK